MRYFSNHYNTHCDSTTTPPQISYRPTARASNTHEQQVTQVPRCLLNAATLHTVTPTSCAATRFTKARKSPEVVVRPRLQPPGVPVSIICNRIHDGFDR